MISMIPIVPHCSQTYFAPLLSDLFSYSYEADFIGTLPSTEQRQLASRQFDFIFRYIVDVSSINNLNFKDNLHEIDSHEPQIKETTESDRSASSLDILSSFDANGYVIVLQT